MKPVVVVVAVCVLAAACTVGALRIRRTEVHRESSRALVVALAVYFTAVFGLIALLLTDE